jgi:hypothetical protein
MQIGHPTLPLLLLCSLAITPAQAEILPVGTEAQVPADPAGSQTAPATAVAPSGGALVVWQSAGAGGEDSDVLARAYGPDGAPLGPELVVNTHLAGCQQVPDVAAARDGTFTVVWQSEGQDGDGSGVFVRRFAADGTPLGTEGQVNSTTAGDQRSPHVAHDAAGNFVVVWESLGQDGDGWSVVARRFGASGPLSSEVIVPTATGGHQRHPDLAFQPTGQVIFAWEGPDGEGSGIFLRRFEGTLGAADPVAVQAHASAAGVQRFPALGIDASGNVIAFWESASPGGSGSRIRARRFDRFLAPVAAEVAADTGSSGPAFRPAVESAGSGDFLALWEEWSSDQSGPGVVVRSFDFREQPASPAGLVHTSFPGEQGRPALAASSDGTFLAAWQSLGQDGDGSGVFARRFAFLGHDFYSIPPCRIVDTRSSSALLSGEVRVLALSTALSACGLPLTARALALNVTAIDATGNGNMALFPGDAALPGTSSINFMAAQNRANSTILSLARNGTATLGASALVGGGGQVHLVLDVGGYFE